MVQELLSNRTIIAGAVGWFAAQVIKTIIYAVMNKTLDLTRMVGDGGMPSAHSATVTSVAMSIAFEYGIGSPVFALAAFFAFIVMHDASGVRLETGKQAKQINDMWELMASLMDEVTSPEQKLKEFVGHTKLQVVMGLLCGVISTLLLYNLVF
ncbi:MAG: divergent PAP2 family protein [bacterium]